MSGRKSKSKGYRGEILLRDSLIAQGFEAKRQPMSGCIKGWEGDIAFSKDGKSWLAELKCRKDSFDVIYEMYGAIGPDLAVAMPNDLKLYSLFSIHSDMDSALNGPVSGLYHPGKLFTNRQGWKDKFNRTLLKILKMQTLLGKSQVLVIRGDRKPFLYIRYVEDKPLRESI